MPKSSKRRSNVSPSPVPRWIVRSGTRNSEKLDAQLLDELDERFFSLEDQGVLDERLLAYIRAHPDEFFTK